MPFQFTPWPFHLEGAGIGNGQLNFFRNFDRFFADTRHVESSLPNERQQFAADPLFASLATGDNPPRSRKDGNTHSAQYAWNIGRTYIFPKSRLADPFHA